MEIAALKREIASLGKQLSLYRNREVEFLELRLKLEKLYEELKHSDGIIRKLKKAQKLTGISNQQIKKGYSNDLAGLDDLRKKLVKTEDANHPPQRQSEISDQKDVGAIETSGDDLSSDRVMPIKGNNWPFLIDSVEQVTKPSLKCSVIIPCYENQSELNTALNWLVAQSYPNNLFEVIVADDGSEIPIEISHFKSSLDIRLVRQERKGFRLAAARNLGANSATGDVLIFLDSDMIPSPDWVLNHALWHHVYPYCLTTGRRFHLDPDDIHPAPNKSLESSREFHQAMCENESGSYVGWIDKIKNDSHHCTEDSAKLASICVGGNVGVRKSLFDMAGGYNEDFN